MSATTNSPPIPVSTVIRFDETQIAALAKSLPTPAVDNDTTPLTAGMKLGVQVVLQKLREGFTIRG
jgi:hypothetical protein